jgi:hypothetical protein
MSTAGRLPDVKIKPAGMLAKGHKLTNCAFVTVQTQMPA